MRHCYSLRPHRKSDSDCSRFFDCILSFEAYLACASVTCVFTIFNGGGDSWFAANFHINKLRKTSIQCLTPSNSPRLIIPSHSAKSTRSILPVLLLCSITSEWITSQQSFFPTRASSSNFSWSQTSLLCTATQYFAVFFSILQHFWEPHLCQRIQRHNEISFSFKLRKPVKSIPCRMVLIWGHYSLNSSGSPITNAKSHTNRALKRSPQRALELVNASWCRQSLATRSEQITAHGNSFKWTLLFEVPTTLSQLLKRLHSVAVHLWHSSRRW